MKKILKILYIILPKSFINKIGKNKSLKRVRDYLLKKNGKAKLITEKIIWEKGSFYFVAPIKMAVKAKKRGIENKLLKNSLKLLKDYNIKNPTIIDIGANYGFISLALQANLEKEAAIYSFEPHPDIFSAFNTSINKNNINNIFSFNVAIGEKECEIDLNLSTQTSNILNSEDREVQKVITIKQVNLDNFFSEKNIKPDYIKIDVDGYEINVLNGLKETISKYKPLMVIESNDDVRVIHFLNQFNYKLLDLDLKEFDDIPNNVFCVR